MMTRDEHLEWAKKRAYAYCDQDNWTEAMQSFFSDLSKHPELKDHVAIELGLMLLLGGRLGTTEAVRTFIEGTR